MPLGLTSTLLSDVLSLRSLILGFLVISTAVSVKRWSSGRKNEWERDWAGKMVLIVGKPTPIVLHLIHHLLHLPHPPEILYLPPMKSPLPQPLLTILHAIRLSASAPLHPPTTNSIHPTDPSTGAESTSAPNPTRPAELTCEPLPHTPSAIRDFIRKWTTPVPGVGQEGRRVDVILWTDGAQLERGFEMFEGEMRRARKEEEVVAKSGVSGAGGGLDEEKTEEAIRWTSEEAKFHLLTALLPSLLKGPMERSIRLINLVSPFYAAGIPYLHTNPDAEPTSSENSTPTGTALSPIAESGISALRSIAWWKHLQKVLNALATVSTGSKAPQAGVEVPSDENSPPTFTEDSTLVPNSQVEQDPAGLRQRKARAEFQEHLENAKTKKGNDKSTIAVQSNILALTVAVGIDRGILRTLIGVRSEGAYSAVGWYLYLFFLPILWFITPSPRSSINSILHAMSAPVSYPESEEAFTIPPTASTDDKEKEKRKPGVSGGAIVRDCESVSIAAPVSQVERYGQEAWDQLQDSVERGVKACIETEKMTAAAGASSTSAPARFGTEAIGQDDEELDEDEEWEKLNAGGEELPDKDSVY